MRFRHLFVPAFILTASRAPRPRRGGHRRGRPAGRDGAPRLHGGEHQQLHPGRKITFRNRRFHCTRPLRRWGGCPSRSRSSSAEGRRFGGSGAIDLDTGCAGDDDPSTIDLIVKVKGNGRTHGPGVDAFKVRQRAGYNRGHPGHRRRRLRAEVPATPTRTASSSRAVATSPSSTSRSGGTAEEVDVPGRRRRLLLLGRLGLPPQNIHVVRGKFIACNHSLFAGLGSGSVVGAKFRSGRVDGTDRRCRGSSARRRAS